MVAVPRFPTSPVGNSCRSPVRKQHNMAGLPEHQSSFGNICGIRFVSTKLVVLREKTLRCCKGPRMTRA